MSGDVKWAVVMVTPGEDELTLLAELSSRHDAKIVAIADPEGHSVGAELADVMGLPVIDELTNLPPGGANYLIYPEMNDFVASLTDVARELGLEPICAADFPRIMSPAAEPAQSPVHRRPSTSTTPDFGFLEVETEAIHRTLSRIEEALDRESLLRWLLGLATRATGADSGSIMLFDETAEELYVAFAYGLSQNTLHRTRIRLGEGIAGRVASSGQAEMIAENQHPGGKRDRSDIQNAVCAPLLWESRLLGVLNLSATGARGQLAQGALEIASSLSHRFGFILDRFLRIQTTRNRDLFRELEEAFNVNPGHFGGVQETLQAWVQNLARTAGADGCKLSVPTADGELLLVTPESCTYEVDLPLELAEIFTSGKPLVYRPEETPGELEPFESSTFHLPVGKNPVRALLSIDFTSPAKGHQFHAVSSDILYLVNRHLTEFLDRAANDDQIDRLTTLAGMMSEMALNPKDNLAAESERVLAAARMLTGAQQAFLLTEEDAEAATALDHVLENAQNDEQTLRLTAARMLWDATDKGWLATSIGGAGGSQENQMRSLLLVPMSGDQPFPGLVLLDKQRLHPLDGRAFTEFDALFARRLLPVIVAQRRRPRTLPAEVAPQTPEAPPPVQPEAATASRDALKEVLKREMDRCDRYHCVLGVVGFRLGPELPQGFQVEKLASELAILLRSSDHSTCLANRVLVLVVPEGLQSLPHLQKRVISILRQRVGIPNLTVTAASRVYPGGGQSPEEILDAIMQTLGLD